MAAEELKPLQVKEIIRSEIRQLPETRWIQNLRHPSYHLRQPIPILIEREGDVVAANYDDLDLSGKGEDVKSAISDLCGKIVACYDGARESADRNGDSPTQEYTFLRQIIVEIQPAAWDEVKELYRERLKGFSYVQKGYINISMPDYAAVIIILSEESVDRIEQLAEIDLEINLKFRPLYFFVEYESSEDNLDLKNFVRFY
jgi:hypothetical protein